MSFILRLGLAWAVERWQKRQRRRRELADGLAAFALLPLFARHGSDEQLELMYDLLHQGRGDD